MDINNLAPIIIAIVAALPGLFALNTQRRKSEADTADVISKAAGQAVKLAQDSMGDFQARIDALEYRVNEQDAVIQLQKRRLDELHGEVETLRARIREYRRGIAILIRQIESSGDYPAYRLPEGDVEL